LGVEADSAGNRGESGRVEGLREFLDDVRVEGRGEKGGVLGESNGDNSGRCWIGYEAAVTKEEGEEEGILSVFFEVVGEVSCQDGERGWGDVLGRKGKQPATIGTLKCAFVASS